MKMLRKTLAALLAVLLCLPMLAACGNNTGSTDTTTQPVTGEPLAEENIYVIVRSDSANNEEKDAAVALRNTLRDEYGVNIVLYTDWYNTADANQKERYPHEIMIGSTNREESKAAKKMITDSEDMYHYVIRGTGNDYVIAAEDGYYQSAVDAFIAMYEADKTMLLRSAHTFDEIKERSFSLEELTIYGKDISEYTAVVYPTTYKDYQKKDAENFSQLIFETTGFRIPVVADDQEYTAPVIRIGGSQNEKVLAAGGFSYSVEKTEDGITLAGTEYYSNWVALDVLECAIREGKTTGKVNFTTEIERISPVKSPVHIGGWNINSDIMTSEEQFKEMKECGFDLVIISTYRSDELMDNYCKWMTKYELQALWRDSYHYADEYFDEDKNPYADYVSAPVTWGNMLLDEPSLSHYERLNRLQDSYTEKFKDNVGFINLFPNYANFNQLGTADYREYVQKCVDIVDPEMLAVDIYPLQVGGSVYNGYLQNIGVFSTVCKEAGIPWMLYIQGNSFDSTVRSPEERDYRWQMWCGLSFGTTGILYFTYRTSLDPAHTPSMIDRENNKTDLWYAGQKVNNELKAISDLYLSYNSLGAYTVGATALYAMFEDQYTDFDAIGEVTYTGDDGVLIGAFEKIEGEGKAFSCVNLTNPSEETEEETTVTVEIKEGNAVTMYRKGVAETLSIVDGRITFSLEVGEGVFITLDPA